MKTLHPSLTTALSNQVSAIAWCWKITRSDGVVMGFTSFDGSLFIDGVGYNATKSFNKTGATSNNAMDIDNLNITSVLDNDSIAIGDLIGGKYDDAKIMVFLVNYLDVPSSLSSNPPKHLLLLDGQLGEVNNSDLSFTAEVRSLLQFFNQKRADFTSKECRYEFCDEDCTLNKNNYTQSLTVSSINSENTHITVSTGLTNSYYTRGYLTFTSGDNEGLTVAILTSDSYGITLFEPMPYPIEEGDTFDAIAGCAKIPTACKSFGNMLNYGGEPDVPGLDEYLSGGR